MNGGQAVLVGVIFALTGLALWKLHRDQKEFERLCKEWDREIGEWLGKRGGRSRLRVIEGGRSSGVGGKLEWRGEVRCIEGHTVFGDARTPEAAEAERWRGAECFTCTDDERSDDPDDCVIAARYVMSDAWREELDRANPWVACEHCDGQGKVRRAVAGGGT